MALATSTARCECRAPAGTMLAIVALVMPSRVGGQPAVPPAGRGTIDFAAASWRAASRRTSSSESRRAGG